MAEIKVQIKGDDEDFKRKMAESAAESREFAAHVKESLAQVKDGVKDILGDNGFGGITKLFSATGIAVGVGMVGNKIVDMFKEGVTAAIEFEDKVSHLKLALGPAQAGMATDIASWVESVSGAMGSVDENMAVFQKLRQSGMGIEEAKKALIDIQNAAAQTGTSVEALGDAFSEMKALGEISPRFFREFPAIGAMVKNLLGPGPPKAPGGPAPTPEAEDEALMSRVKEKGGASWMLRTVLPAISPGGMQSQARIEIESTTEGQLKNLGVQFEEVSRELGTALLPTIKEFVGDIRAAMPEITETVHHWSEDLKELLDSVHKNLGWLGRDVVADRYPGQRTVEATHEKLAAIVTGHMESVIDLKAAAQEQRAAAEALHRAVNPQ
jgi:hypothetical protein